MDENTGEEQGGRRAFPWPVLVAAVVVVLGLLAAGVTLTLAGQDQGQILGLLAGLATVAGVLLGVFERLFSQQQALDAKQDKQTEILQQVKWNTNGNLQRIIDAAVASAAAKHFPINGSTDPEQTPGPEKLAA